MSKADSTNGEVQAAGTALFGHIVQKGMQTGAVLGTAAVLPITGFRAFRRGDSLATFLSATTGRLTRWTVYTALVTAAVGAARMSTLDADGIQDRAYRLTYNDTQNRTDRFAQHGAALGLAAGLLLRRPLALPSTIAAAGGAASIGAALGIFAHVASYRGDTSGPNRMLEELKS